MSVLGVLSEAGPVSIFSDAQNHASIIDGTRLATRNGATVHIYRSFHALNARLHLFQDYCAMSACQA